MKKIRAIKNTWYDCLINYISDLIRKSVDGFKDKSLSLFKTKTPKQAMYRRGKKLGKPETQNKKKEEIWQKYFDTFWNRRRKKRKRLVKKKN